MAPSINTVKQKLQQYPMLPEDQHVHTANNYTPGICPQNAYFLFQSRYYEQVHGTAMGSPISPLTANLFMEELEVMALSSAPHLLACD